MIQKENDTVDMFCEATGTPEPTLTWSKDEQDLSPSQRIVISGNSIQVKKLVRSDGGRYSCIFQNIVGQVSHTIKLIIEGRCIHVKSVRFSSKDCDNELKNASHHKVIKRHCEGCD